MFGLYMQELSCVSSVIFPGPHLRYPGEMLAHTLTEFPCWAVYHGCAFQRHLIWGHDCEFP